MGSEKNNFFKLIFEKGGDKEQPAFTAPVPVKNEAHAGPANDKIKNLIKIYLKESSERDMSATHRRVSGVYQGEELKRRVLYLPEARLQNSLELGGSSQKIQAEVKMILSGVESAKDAFLSLDSKLKKEHPTNETWVATNDQLDAMHKVDLLGVVEDKSQVHTLYLVQVKSSADNGVILDTTKAHQEYMAILPQLIGPLNKKESSTIVERELAISEVLDRSRSETNEEAALFSLVLEQYINDTSDLTQINAADFYEKYKKEGGVFNPFIVMGILKKKENLSKYLNTDTEIQNRLSQTAENIPYSEAESIAFYKKNNTNTILDTTEIYSVVMEKGKEIYRKKLDIKNIT